MNPNQFVFPSRQGLRKSDLAKAYFPDVCLSTARRNLLRWIIQNPELQQRLHESGYQKDQRYFTPVQVGILYDVLGEP